MVLGWESGWRIWSVSLGGGTRVSSPWSASDCTGDVTVTKTRQTTCNAWARHWGTVRCFQGLNANRLQSMVRTLKLGPWAWLNGDQKFWNTNFVQTCIGRQGQCTVGNTLKAISMFQADLTMTNQIQKKTEFHCTAKRRNNLGTTGG